MRFTKKKDIDILATLKKSNILMTEKDYKELKLGQLENIEDRLGFELITLFEHRTLAEIVGYVWYKIEHPKKHKEVIIKRQVCTFQDYKIIVVKSYDEDYVCGLSIKDYGKTWALTKEELL